MAIPSSRNKTTSERMVASLKRLVSLQGGGAAAAGKKTFTADDYFQQSPLSAKFFQGVFGSNDNFFDRYQSFADEYFDTLENKANHAKGTKVYVDLMRRRGKIDLNLLNKETSDRLYDKYVREVLQLDSVIRQGGLPGIEMPSANLYSKSLRFMTEADSRGVMHPAQILYNRSFFNFNPRKMDLEALTVSRSNILNVGAVREMYRQSRTGDIFSGIKDGMKVVTLDIETTGVYDFSQARSLAAVESVARVDQSGKVVLGAPKGVANMIFDSPQLAGVKVNQLNGGSISLSKFLAQSEGVKTGAIAMSDFLDEGAKFVDRIVQADRVAGHNVYFDLDKITQTMMEMDGFGQHKGAQQALKTLWDKVNGGNFLVDTLESARTYLDQQANEIVKLSKAATLDEKADTYVRSLFSTEILAKVHVGGAAAPFSMENIALNTNLFELIERDGQAEELFGLITRGSHVAETDVHLQTYMANYVQSGELKLWGLTDRSKTETEFGRTSRAKILKSQAITPTTNMADVQNISANLVKYLAEGEGAQNVSINISKNHDVFGGRFGTLSYIGDEFKLITESGFESVDQDIARDLVKRVVYGARDVNNLSQVVVDKVKGTTAQVNLDDLAINDINISYGGASRILQLEQIGRMPISTTVTGDAIKDAFGSVYEAYGSGLSARDQVNSAFNIGPRDSVFQVGLGNFADNVPAQVASKFAAIGDPFYFLDAESRAISTSIAEATARTGKIANKAAIAAGTNAADIAFSSSPNMMAEIGISYFKAQEEMSAFMPASKELGTSKIVAPTELLKQAYTGFKDDTFRGLTMSIIDRAEGERVNLVWDVKRQMNRDEARTIMANLFDLMSDKRNVAKAMGIEVTQLNESIKAEIAFNETTRRGGKAARDRAIDLATDVAMDRGIVLGYADGDEAKGIIGTLKRMGLSTGNDVNIRNLMGDFLRTKLGKETVAVGPFAFRDSLNYTDEGQKLLAEASEVLTPKKGEKISKVVQQANKIAEIIGSDKGLRRDVTRNIKYAKSGDSARVLADFYTAHKPKLGIGLAVSAIAGVGYYKAKKNREKALYDETMQRMPTQSAMQQDPLAELKEAYNYAPQRMNPLATAGVVGNLDQNKIGHYQMGTNKYDHLFGR